MSVRLQHCLDHANKFQQPNCLLGIVPQPTNSRLSETNENTAIILCVPLLRVNLETLEQKHTSGVDAMLSFFVCLCHQHCNTKPIIYHIYLLYKCCAWFV